MILGKTSEQVREDHQRKKDRKKRVSGKWLRKFAWWPVWLTDGRILFLGWVECQETYTWSNDGHEYYVVKYKSIAPKV